MVDWAIPAAYVSNGYEVLNESGQVVRVVPAVKTDIELERDAAAARAEDAEAAAQTAQLERDTLSQQLTPHQASLNITGPSGEASSQYEEETVAALQAEIQSLDEATEGRQQQAAALAEAYSRDIARFSELEEVVALRRQTSLSPSSP